MRTFDWALARRSGAQFRRAATATVGAIMRSTYCRVGLSRSIGSCLGACPEAKDLKRQQVGFAVVLRWCSPVSAKAESIAALSAGTARRPLEPLIAGDRLKAIREFESESPSPQIPPGAPSAIHLPAWPLQTLASQLKVSLDSNRQPRCLLCFAGFIGFILQIQ